MKGVYGPASTRHKQRQLEVLASLAVLCCMTVCKFRLGMVLLVTASVGMQLGCVVHCAKLADKWWHTWCRRHHLSVRACPAPSKVLTELSKSCHRLAWVTNLRYHAFVTNLTPGLLAYRVLG